MIYSFKKFNKNNYKIHDVMKNYFDIFHLRKKFIIILLDIEIVTI